MPERAERVRAFYRAFAEADRDAFEQMLAEEFTFSSPLDVGLDRAGFFERCWPGAGHGQQFEIERLLEVGDEVVVTYERIRPDGRRGRNTEVLTFDGDLVTRAEVYFGWDL
jgi:ketosteroid isomerase-like protein